MRRTALFAFLSLLLILPVFANPLSRFQAGFSAGFGFPQVPPSQFRLPFSIVGGGTLRFRVTDKMVLKTCASALTSYSLGTVNGGRGTLRFDLRFLTLSLARRWKGDFGSSAYYFAGLGNYRLDQQISENIQNRKTTGLHIGMEYLKAHASVDTFFELNWHLLFHPSSNPQVLLLSFGVIL